MFCYYVKELIFLEIKIMNLVIMKVWNQYECFIYGNINDEFDYERNVDELGLNYNLKWKE